LAARLLAAELIWTGKTYEVTIQSIEQIDEPRAESAAAEADLFDSGPHDRPATASLRANRRWSCARFDPASILPP
jgi:hypothetical protein